MQLFAQRLNALEEIIVKLEQTPPTCRVPLFQQLEDNKTRLSLLQAYIKSADSLNTGGSFEWVDSRIVTSLKCGQFILLEHVNLCSSAVLDRLNPVFEPNGSLLIAEKGISAQDTAEVVRKSPNFRAFLTVDPKNGELSRAMRNRCVELALTLSKDAYSVDDMRAIVHGQGVHQIEAINCMLAIHRNIVQLTEFNAYTISHLTQFAFLSAAYKRIGYELKRAIYVAAMEVYVYAANMDLMGYGLSYYQNKLREVVIAETETFVEEEINQKDYLNDVILATDELDAMSLIKLQTATLKVVLHERTEEQLSKKRLTSLFQPMESLELSQINPQKLCEYLIYMLYEECAFDDLELRHLYLQDVLSDHLELKQFSAHLCACLLKQGTAFQASLTGLPWNRKLFPRLRDYAITAHPKNADDESALALSASLLAQLLLEEIPKQPVGKLQLVNALQYSQALLEKKITDKYSNDFLRPLATFLDELQLSLREQLSSARFQLPQYVKFLTKFFWFNRLLSSAQQKLLQGNELYAPVMHKLVLHFKWLEKHLLAAIQDAWPDFLNSHAALRQCIKQLSSYVQEIKRPLNESSKFYAKQFTQFQPYYLEQQVSGNSNNIFNVFIMHSKTFTDRIA